MNSAAIAIFIGSFLLFLLQPMLGRTLLPLFGGSAAVWTVCLAAYQLLLLAGYLYAHGVARLSTARQRLLHLGLLGLALVWLAAFALARPWLPAYCGNSSWPALEVLVCVLLFVGPPYVLLAAGSSLVQAWAAGGRSGGTERRGSVYSLYAISNLGSFAGLLIFPLALEPFMALRWQWTLFGAGVLGYLLVLLNWRPAAPQAVAEAGAPRLAPPPFNRLWFLLPGYSAFLLNAVVAHLFADVTPVPLVWVAMLAAFLLSYATGFSRAAAFMRPGWSLLALLSFFGAARALGLWGSGSFYPNALAGLAVIFFGGTVAHGWLFDSRPPAAGLTRYYLAIAAGGAVGGLLAALAAPLLFSKVQEFPLALCLGALLVALRPVAAQGWLAQRPARILMGVVCAALWLVFMTATARRSEASELFRGRNFYGTVRVTQTFEQCDQGELCPVHYLWCGQTTHGVQVISPLVDPRATSYYSAAGGGIAFASHPATFSGERMKVAVVGLGAGCLAAYGRAGDHFRFHEINPLMIKLASDRRYFSFLHDAPMPIDFVPGDARKMLETERANRDPLYDILLVDAYSGDAVPYHLVTLEAFRLYLDRLAADGILALHVSNWHIDLLPVCKAVATELNLHAYGVLNHADSRFVADSMWVFMSRYPRVYQVPRSASVREVEWSKVRDIAAPTDERGSLLTLMR